MANKSKALGTKWETAIVKWLTERGVPCRRLPLGGSDDHGDIVLDEIPIIIQAKYRSSTPTTREVRNWLQQAWEQARNHRVHYRTNQTPCPVLVIKVPRSASPSEAVWLSWSCAAQDWVYTDGFGFMAMVSQHWIHYVPED